MKLQRIAPLMRRALSSSPTSASTSWLRVSDEVRAALAASAPVVALESALLTHGLPRPINVHVTRDMQQIVRANGAVPACVGVLRGEVHVGLSASQVEELGEGAPAAGLHKLAKRDLALAAARRLSGGTTVSATAFLAHCAGIAVFATGGIGGVHRASPSASPSEVGDSWDVSADLVELSRTPIAVVCAGAKSILDVPRTLEFLETHGVLVAALRTDDFPAFIARESGCPAPARLESVAEAADALYTIRERRLGHALLLAVPIPEQHAMPRAAHESALSRALEAARERRVVGKAVTPFLLEQVAKLSGSASVAANVELLKHNAAVGSQLAVQFAARCRAAGASFVSSRHLCTSAARRSPKPSSAPESRYVAVIGAAMLDTMLHVQNCAEAGFEAQLAMAGGANPIFASKSYPAIVKYAAGGVGRNIAECIARCGTRAVLFTTVGQDPSGDALIEYMNEINTGGYGETTTARDEVRLDLSRVKPTSRMPTAAYFSVLKPNGAFVFGANSALITERITSDYILENADVISKASLLIMDTNIPASTIATAINMAAPNGVPIWLEPTASMKALRAVQSGALSKLSCITPNYKELGVLAHELESSAAPPPDANSTPRELDALLSQCVDWCRVLSKYVPNVLVKLGPHGVLLARRLEPGTASDAPFPIHYVPPGHSANSGRAEAAVKANAHAVDTRLSVVHYAAFPKDGAPTVINASGAGDCLVGGIAHGIVSGWKVDEAVRTGLRAAYLSVQSIMPVPTSITEDSLSEKAVLEWAGDLKPTQVL